LNIGIVVWSAYYSVIDAERAKAQNQLHNAQLEYRAQKDDLALLKDKAEHQLVVLQLKIGELQGQVNRLNAFSQELAKVADIPDSEFNFSASPAIGGGPGVRVTELAVAGGSTLMRQMDDLLMQLDGQEQKMALLESILLNHNIEKDSYLSGRPITSGWLSSYFGARKDPFTGLPAVHKGIDFASKHEDEVIATEAGVISWASERYGWPDDRSRPWRWL
jgi:murein DD-endopeptidase MepM/ murein hydrolase activator NlpD